MFGNMILVLYAVSMIQCLTWVAWRVACETISMVFCMSRPPPFSPFPLAQVFPNGLTTGNYFPWAFDDGVDQWLLVQFGAGDACLRKVGRGVILRLV